MKTTRKSATSAQALSLPQRLQAVELERHAGRLANIKRMHARLMLLDAFMPDIESAGVRLSLHEMTDWGGKHLSLTVGVLNRSLEAKLVNVLLANGMKVEERKDWPGEFGHSTFYLKKGRLRVSVMVDRRAMHLLELAK
jgi:hypothetical protein